MMDQSTRRESNRSEKRKKALEDDRMSTNTNNETSSLRVNKSTTTSVFDNLSKGLSSIDWTIFIFRISMQRRMMHFIFWYDQRHEY